MKRNLPLRWPYQLYVVFKVPNFSSSSQYGITTGPALHLYFSSVQFPRVAAVCSHSTLSLCPSPDSSFVCSFYFLFIYDKCPDVHYDVPDLAIYCDLNLILHTIADSVIIRTLLSVICCSQILWAQYAVNFVYRKCQITFRVPSQSTIRIEHDNMGN